MLRLEGKRVYCSLQDLCHDLVRKEASPVKQGGDCEVPVGVWPYRCSYIDVMIERSLQY